MLRRIGLIGQVDFLCTFWGEPLTYYTLTLQTDFVIWGETEEHKWQNSIRYFQPML